MAASMVLLMVMKQKCVLHRRDDPLEFVTMSPVETLKGFHVKHACVNTSSEAPCSTELSQREEGPWTKIWESKFGTPVT